MVSIHSMKKAPATLAGCGDCRARTMELAILLLSLDILH
jgi:hypothetical protein